MKSAYASSKTALAECLQISRPTLYSYLHLPDAPRPKSNGMWKVSEVRRYIRKQEGKRKITSTEKEQLEVELLRKRITRVDLEISELDNSRREEITDKITGECRRVVDALNSQLWRMPDELSGIFSVLAEPMAIYKRFKAELHQRFQAAQEALQKIKEQSRRKTPKNKKEAENVAPFKRSAVN
jgi:DNA primase